VQDADLTDRGLTGTPEECRALERIRELEMENEILPQGSGVSVEGES
jgi:hypothetical protein